MNVQMSLDMGSAGLHTQDVQPQLCIEGFIVEAEDALAGNELLGPIVFRSLAQKYTCVAIVLDHL